MSFLSKLGGMFSGGGSTNLGTMLVQVDADTTGLVNGMTKVSKTISQAEIDATRSVKRMGLAIGTAVAGMAVYSTMQFAKFDQAMTQSTAIMSGVTAETRKEMEAMARSIARDGITSASDLAESYYFLASAGMDAEQSIASLAHVEKFAVAGAFNMARATDLLTDAQSALGLTSKDVATNQRNLVRVSDVLVKANTLANASVEQFSESLTNKAGASLRILNKDIEEGVAILAAYADQGVKGTEAGEKLAIVLRDLQRTARTNVAEWEALNVAVFDGEGNMRSIIDIVADLEGALDGMSDAQLGAQMEMLGFQDRSVQAITALLGTSDALRNYEAELRRAGGTTAEVANRQLQSFTNQMTILKNTVLDAALSVGSALAPLALALVGKLDPLHENYILYKALATAMLAVGGTMAAMKIGSMIATLRIWAGATWSLVGAKAALNRVMLANPVGLVLTGVSLLAVGYFGLASNASAAAYAQGMLTEATHNYHRLVKGDGTLDEYASKIKRIEGELISAREHLMNLLDIAEGRGEIPVDIQMEAFREGIPVAEALARRIELVQAGLGQLDTQMTRVKDGQAFVRAMGEATAVVESARSEIERLEASLETIQAGFSPTAHGADMMSQAMEVLRLRIEELKRAADQSDAARLKGIFEGVFSTEAVTALREDIAFVEAQLAAAGGESEKLEHALKLLHERLQSLDPNERDAALARGALATPFTDAVAKVEEFDRLLRNNLITLDEYQALLQKVMQEGSEFLQTDIFGAGMMGAGMDIPGIGGREAELLNEREEMLRESYERQREIILNSTMATEQERLQILETMERSYQAKMAQFSQARNQMMLSHAEGVAGQMLSVLESFGQEQTGLYKVLFAASKAFAIADILIKTEMAAANAMALYPPPYNMVMAGITRALGYASMAAVVAETVASFEGGGFTPAGARSGGIDGRGGFMAVLHPNEKVTDLNRPDTDGRGGTELNVVINNYTDVQPEVTRRDDRTLEVTIRRVKEEMASDIRDGRGALPMALQGTYKLRRGV